ncbi:helix-turn-helix domain-containing protein [Ramlibacter sp. AN1015]|uniref:helix-turn-helix domain-containing protein n=1 Tax=Ramlibacter sp. AN1015 TaxID=3133428 RepID=UPI0030BF0EBB
MSEVVDVADTRQAASAGALLREARERAGLHVAALAGALKVPQRQLEALEQDRLELLPDVVYARALAASVCRTLKIDSRQVLSLLPKGGDSRLGKVEPINVPFRASGDVGRSAGRELLRRPPVLAALALLVGAVVLLLLPLIPNRQEPAATGDAMVKPEAASNAAAGSTTGAGDAATSAAAPLALPGTVTEAVVPPGAALAGATPSAGVPQVAPVTPVAPVAPPLPTSGGTVPGASAGAATTSAGSDAAVEAPVIQFSARQAAWVQVTDSRGSVYLRRMLAAGETVGVSGATPLAVVVGNVSNVQVQVRGRPHDVASSTRDNVARFEVR